MMVSASSLFPDTEHVTATATDALPAAKRNIFTVSRSFDCSTPLLSTRADGDAAATEDNSSLSDSSSSQSPSSASFSFSPSELARQQQEIDDERAARTAAIAANYAAEASAALPQHIRCVALLGESHRQELLRVAELRQKEGSGLTAERAEFLRKDLAASYGSLAHEVKTTILARTRQMLLQQRIHVGCATTTAASVQHSTSSSTGAAPLVLGQQAVQCFASLYPWSSSLLVGEMSPYSAAFANLQQMPLRTTAAAAGKCGSAAGSSKSAVAKVGESGHICVLSIQAMSACADARREGMFLRAEYAISQANIGLQQLLINKKNDDEEEKNTDVDDNGGGVSTETSNGVVGDVLEW